MINGSTLSQMTKEQKDALRTFENNRWKETQECIEQLKKVNTKEEYAIVFDLNGFGENDLIPQVFKDLRNKIK